MSNAAGPVAAYLYTLSLDASGLAWEYLRRNRNYEQDWQRHGRARGPDEVARTNRYAEPWGLRFP
ncbi:transcriptional regulator domain-containing protein [Lichenicoccus sp.]|uniref:transcriptional regulator domain-containing protein n=1 Tax=Lichenicoccus sp. TaxID=2781899 RepID=UPI003D0AEEE7